ncbi:MAG: substrate-binding domain-containing protein [Lentisphaeria bacterium]|nr:MAG: substrate-binding domain-containing protein [Lentisphaeria bacterium]
MKKRHAKTVLFAKNFYLQQELRGIVDYAREHGWQLEMPQMFSLRSHIRNWRGDGYLTDTGSGVEPLHDAGVRVVGLSLDPVLKRFADGIVAPDNLRIGVVAAEYFLRRGHRNFAVCTDCYGRDRAFEERIAQDGFRAVRLSMPRYFRSPQTIDLLARKLVRLPRLCAVFCNNDWEAAAIFNAAALARRKVPEEIALIGVGNEELLCTATEPRLSSVETRLYERGFFAARMLDRMMEEGRR